MNLGQLSMSVIAYELRLIIASTVKFSHRLLKGMF